MIRILPIFICFFVDRIALANGHSVSVQLGINGAVGASQSFGLQFVPPDLSYTYEFFDNNRYTFSTSSFYDNIGVQINDINFKYRVGQRVDANYKTKNGLLYGTLGFGFMVESNANYTVSPLYGFGITHDILEHIAVVTEINFQNSRHYEIVNLSVGIILSFM